MGILDKLKSGNQREEKSLLEKLKTGNTKGLESAREIKSGQFRQDQITSLPPQTNFVTEKFRPDQLDKPNEVVSIDLNNIQPNTPEEQARIDSFKQRESQFRERKKPINLQDVLGFKSGGTALEKIARPLTTVSRFVEAATKSKPTTTGLIEGTAASAIKSVPLVGDLVVSDEQMAQERLKTPKLGTVPENVPFIGGNEIRSSDITGTAANLGISVAQYSAVNKALKGLGATSKLASLLGSSKKAQFGATQAIDLMADVIVQAPNEVIQAIKNDDTIGQFAKDTLLNRGLDIIINAAIGGAVELNQLKKLKQSAPEAVERAIKNIPESTQKQIIESQLKDIEVPKDRITVSDFKMVDDGVSDSASMTLRQDVLESQMKDGNADTFRNKIDRGQNQSLISRLKSQDIDKVLENFNKAFIDDVGPLAKLERQIKGSVSSAEESIYKQARLFKGAPEVANEILRTQLKPAIKIAENAGYTYKDLGDYALAMHAKDVNNAGLKSGFSDSEIRATLDKYNVPELEAARQELMSVSNSLLSMMKDDGLINSDQLKALQEKWTNYMPLFRSFDDSKVEFSKGISDSFSNVTAPIKKLTGSDRDVIDPIESMVKNIYKTVDATRRNRVGTQLAKLSEIDVDNSFIRKLDAGETVGRKNVVNVTVDGQKVPFEVEPEIYKVFNNLDKESSNALISLLSKPASLLRAGATLTPEFALRNPLRDIQNAFIVSKSGFNPITDFTVGLASTMKKGDLYQKWIKESGGYGNILSMDRQAHKQALESVLSQSPTKKFINVTSPKGMLSLLRSVSDITESATKVGEFRAALRSGATPSEAAFRARDLMDFARAGNAIRPANKIVAFLNANIQGKSKLIRAIKENPAKVTAKTATSMALPSLAAYALTQRLGNENQKQTIKDAPDWQKNTFWLIPLPGTDIVVRIPKPFDVSFVANGTERFIDYTLENDPKAFDGFVKQTIKDQAIPIMLTGLMPWLEGMANYSFFRQGPIISGREENLKREDQFDSRTSEIARFMAKGAEELLGEDSNLSSPRVIDYILRTSAGGLGSSILDSTDWFLDKVGFADKPPKPELGVTQLPLIKGFTVNQASSGKSLSDFYELRQSLTRQKGSANLKNEPFNKQPLLDFLNDQAKTISEISKQIREVNESREMTPEEKRQTIDKLTKLRNDISFNVMKEVGDID